MEASKISSIFVVNKEKVLQGIITIDSAIDALKKGETDINNLLIQDVEKTDPDTPLVDLLPVAVHAKYPIAVVNEQQRLLGIICLLYTSILP